MGIINVIFSFLKYGRAFLLSCCFIISTVTACPDPMLIHGYNLFFRLFLLTVEEPFLPRVVVSIRKINMQI